MNYLLLFTLFHVVWLFGLALGCLRLTDQHLPKSRPALVYTVGLLVALPAFHAFRLLVQ